MGSNHDFLCHFATDGHAGFFYAHDQVSTEGVNDRDIAADDKTEIFQMLFDLLSSADPFDDVVFADVGDCQWHHILHFPCLLRTGRVDS